MGRFSKQFSVQAPKALYAQFAECVEMLETAIQNGKNKNSQDLHRSVHKVQILFQQLEEDYDKRNHPLREPASSEASDAVLLESLLKHFAKHDGLRFLSQDELCVTIRKAAENMQDTLRKKKAMNEQILLYQLREQMDKINVAMEYILPHEKPAPKQAKSQAAAFAY